MNLDDLIAYAEEHKKEVFKQLDDLNLDIERIEDCLKGLPIDQSFQCPVFETLIDEPTGYLFIQNDRIYFHWKSNMASNEICLRPLVEYPTRIRLLCQRFLVNFLKEILKRLGLDV